MAPALRYGGKNIPQRSIALLALRLENGAEFSPVRIDVPPYKKIYRTRSDSGDVFLVDSDRIKSATNVIFLK